MDSEALVLNVGLEKCCECSYSYCSTAVGNSQHWNRVVKLKVDGLDDENVAVLCCLGYPVPATARVQIENEGNMFSEVDNDFTEVDKYSFGGIPSSIQTLKNLELRI